MRGKLVNVLLFALVLTAIGLGAALVYKRLGARLAPESAETTLGEARLRVPPAYARFPIGRAGGVQDRLELAATFPAFAPVAAPQAGKDAPGPLGAVFITLTPRDRSVDPAERPVALYGRFLEEDAWSDPTGLIMRRFQPGSPYEFEDLYIAPPEGRVFSARCTRPRQPADGLGETCLTALRIGGIDAQLRYPPALLAHWEILAARARALIESMMR